MNLENLNFIANHMTAPGTGILAADESHGTIKKRFDNIAVESTETNRRDWREMLFRSNEAMTKYIGGVILFDETLRQKSDDGTPLVDLIDAAGAVPGIKVDAGAHDMAGFSGEKVTNGLDGLRDRMKEYYQLGARFAKWRAVIEIDGHRPSAACVSTNTHALARYAAICQEAQIVPIVEPEVLMGGEHTIDRYAEVTEWVLKHLFMDLHMHGVALEGIVLKPNMVISGKTCAVQADVDEVAEKTVRVLRATVPASVPGVAFLSGGQGNRQATVHLNAMNAGYDLPWNLTFSFGRALQKSALAAWKGKNVAAGQAAFAHRAKMNSLASLGKWTAEQEAELDG
ncbi:MAG: fructose-bisphosphate aldolase class I [Robiginitomaculum sp.]|nr:MAG: fructose-bisphosphate aldolase class I [Robiginitomaculum sp.]